MAKREFIDRNELLIYGSCPNDCTGGYGYAEKYCNIDKIFQCPIRVFDKEAIWDCSTFTEQDIVKPYLDKITEHLGNLIDKNMEVKSSTIEPNQYAYCYQEILEFIDSLLSEPGDVNDKDKI